MVQVEQKTGKICLNPNSGNKDLDVTWNGLFVTLTKLKISE